MATHHGIVYNGEHEWSFETKAELKSALTVLVRHDEYFEVNAQQLTMLVTPKGSILLEDKFNG